MLRLVKCEFAKLRRRRLFQVAFLTTFILPTLWCLLLSNTDLDNMMSVVREENGFLILLPLTVVIAANLFFEEHDHDTLKNLLCVPVTRGRLVLAKLWVLLLFDLSYMAAGYGLALVLTAVSGFSVSGWRLQMFLTLGSGALLWAAALPCILLVVWCNKSYIISVIIAFAYTLFGYILHFSDAVTMVPLGLNIQTFLPVPMMERWLYQFHSMEGVGEESLVFYERFRPYFVTTQAIFAVMAVEAVFCMALIVRVYRKQSV